MDIMNIKIDTSLLMRLANESLNAKALVEDAVAAADKVTAHDDWNCVERDAINESIMKIRNNNGIINENAVNVANKINGIAEKFNEYDGSLKSKFSGFDSSVGKMLCVKNGNEAAVSPANNVINSVAPLRNATYMQSYHLNNLTKPISVLRFSDAESVASNGRIPFVTQSREEMLRELTAAMGLDR